MVLWQLRMATLTSGPKLAVLIKNSVDLLKAIASMLR
jgi:hypothetical protein